MAWSSGKQLMIEAGGNNYFSSGVGNDTPFAEDINAIIQAARGNYIVSGLGFSAGAEPDLSISGTHLVIAAGVSFNNGTKRTVSTANIDLETAFNAMISGQSRYVEVYVNSSGTIATTSGAIATTNNQVPVVDANNGLIPEDGAIVCRVYLEFDDTSFDITNQIMEDRIDAPVGGFFAGDIHSNGIMYTKQTSGQTDPFATDATHKGYLVFGDNSITEEGGIEWFTSGFESGFGFKLYAHDAGGGTNFHLAARRNASTWTNFLTLTDVGVFTFGGNIKLDADDRKIFQGAGDDVSTSWDGTDYIINPALVSAGKVRINGDTLPFSDSNYDLGATGTRWANAYFDTLFVASDIADQFAILTDLTGTTEFGSTNNATKSITYVNVTNPEFARKEGTYQFTVTNQEVGGGSQTFTFAVSIDGGGSYSTIDSQSINLSGGTHQFTDSISRLSSAAGNDILYRITTVSNDWDTSGYTHATTRSGYRFEFWV